VVRRRALVAALFLDDLDQQHLAAADHVLDLVAAAQILPLAPQLVGGILFGALSAASGWRRSARRHARPLGTLSSSACVLA
jgi:hypothetical protein